MPEPRARRACGIVRAVAAALAVCVGVAGFCGVGLAQAGLVPAGEGAAATLETADGPRTYRIFAPTTADAAPEAPALVVVLHGNGGDGAQIAAVSGFDAVAAREGFVVAYPDGLRGSWNYVRGIPGYPEAPDDAAFLRALVARVQAERGADPARTYVVGYSNGGFMAQRLLCEAPEAFAGAVSVSAAGFAGLERLCEGAPPRSLALMHGTLDENVPWDGLPVSAPGGAVLITWPVATTFAWWAERAACATPAARAELPPDPALRVSSVVVLRLDRCGGGQALALYALVGGGHAWPRGATFDGARQAWRFLAGAAPQ